MTTLDALWHDGRQINFRMVWLATWVEVQYYITMIGLGILYDQGVLYQQSLPCSDHPPWRLVRQQDILDVEGPPGRDLFKLSICFNIVRKVSSNLIQIISKDIHTFLPFDS
ncbi:hypothetical protein VNO77_33994 [Canavalia gladiata]|uniref:Uncharacterized protein n=1 Tax=Canavalia gladiata TaxID=3824 RepID=A0AAN9KDL2_CANGL